MLRRVSVGVLAFLMVASPAACSKKKPAEGEKSATVKKTGGGEYVPRPRTETVDCTKPHGPLTFPEPDRTCTTDADCELGNHQIDCCGLSYAWAFNKKERDPFSKAEAACDSQFPACNCSATAVLTEDGKCVTDKTPAKTHAEPRCTAGKCGSIAVSFPDTGIVCPTP